MHTPVMLDEVVDALAVQSGGVYIDATAGEGGHLRKILSLGGKVLALDWDASQIKRLQEEFKENKAITFAVSNFANIATTAKKNGFEKVDGIIFDLGLSMIQITSGKRG